MEHFIGIDLGTTYSAVSTIDDYGRPVILPNSDGERLTPSAIFFNEKGQVLIGGEAKDMMNNAGADVAVFFKRFMGDSSFTYTANGRSYSATDLSALLLTKLKRDAENQLGSPIRKAVITVPAYFNDLQRTETIKAARQAGLDVLRIINEPTAAAITYGISQKSGCRILVYDLGGGTFDVTVLEVNDGVMRVIATGGDHKLGGKDWDDALMNYVVNNFECEYGSNPLHDAETYGELLYLAERTKKQLSSTTRATINFRYNGCHGRYIITREMFEELTLQLMHNTQQKTEEVLRCAGLGWKGLDGVLLVGGSTKMPIVSKWVEQMSGKPPLTGVNVDEAVCLGAAIQASLDMQGQAQRFGLPVGSNIKKFTLPGGNIKIQDVMSHSLGAVAVNKEGTRYVNSIIIARNLNIPVTEKRPFKLNVKQPGQTMEVYLTQGETSEIRDCTIVGYYVISEMIPADAPAIIDICYSYDDNGIINVTASQHTSSGLHPLTVEKKDIPSDMDWIYLAPVKAKPLCIYLSIDLSGSMGGKRINRAREAANEFIRNINLDSAIIAISGFADKFKIYEGPLNDAYRLYNSVERHLDVNGKIGYGNAADPISACYNDMSRIKEGHKCVMVILTDGYWDRSACKRALEYSDRCRSEEIDIIGIGIGGADEEFLKRISTISAMTDLTSLVKSFGTIAQELSNSGSATSIFLNK